MNGDFVKFFGHYSFRVVGEEFCVRDACIPSRIYSCLLNTVGVSSFFY